MRTAAVDIWTVDLDQPRPALLSPDEQERASRFRFPEHRMHWTNAHSALREVLGECLQKDPLTLSFSCNAHGKPALAGIEFNLSHTQRFAMIAVCSDAAIGVDIEHFRSHVDLSKLLLRLGETDLQQQPAALHQRWVRREAASKAQGGQLFDPLDTAIQIADLSAPTAHFAALAVVGAMPLPHYCGRR